MQINSPPQIAFYAPLKSPLHSTPSGDRRIAQLFFDALLMAGYEVQLASQLRSFDKRGDTPRQQRLVRIGQCQAQRIMRRWQRQNFAPVAWLSYHLYYKAPDLIGPIICKALNIPYLIAEASWAEKRAKGHWELFHQQVDSALQLAAKVVCINPIDKIALTHYYRSRAESPIDELKAFIDTHINQPRLSRQQIADTYSLDPAQPWLITVAMMRSGDKFASYQLLSQVIHKLKTTCQLLIIGDGETRPQVQGLFKGLPEVIFGGAIANSQVLQLLEHFEILVWPAINEALGMVFLEAQLAKVAIVAGDEGGVSSIVDANNSGILTIATDTQAMSAAVDSLLQSPESLSAMQQAAQHKVISQHSLQKTAVKLQTIIQHAVLKHTHNEK
jgi:glycosyltransferase involved in cell wall biosynthesis